MPPSPPSPPAQCLVFAYLETLLGVDPMAGQAVLTIENRQTFSPPGSGVLVPATKQAFPCDQYGYVSAEVIASVSAGIAYLFEIQYTDQLNQTTTYKLGWAQVPAQSQLDLSTVTFTQNSDGSN